MNRSCIPCSILQIPFYALISHEHIFEISLYEIVTWVYRRSSKTQDILRLAFPCVICIKKVLVHRQTGARGGAVG